MEIKKVNLALNSKLHQKLKLKAVENNMSLYKLIIQLLEKGV